MKTTFGQVKYIALPEGWLIDLGRIREGERSMECKANERNDALPSVQFQEASQIAAWLMQSHLLQVLPLEGALNIPKE